MRHVFGPIPSRRLGQSLGIDPVPFKTCNWNCVYCQLGRTSPFVGERRDYIPPDDIVAQVADVLRRSIPGTIDWVTFVGSGEPTLHASLGRMIMEVKSMTSIPVAVITNGSLMHLSDVREQLLLADAVLPTVDAGTDRLYRQINRPMPELNFERFIEGLIDFRRAYTGKLWVEVMLIKGLNDSEAALTDLSRVLNRIQPTAVHLNLPIRPPCESWMEPSDEAGLTRAVRILGDVAHIVGPAQTALRPIEPDGIADAIIDLITRHPIAEDELVEAFAPRTPQHVRATLDQLLESGRAQVVTRHGRRFWSYAAARYVARSTT